MVGESRCEMKDSHSNLSRSTLGSFSKRDKFSSKNALFKNLFQKLLKTITRMCVTNFINIRAFFKYRGIFQLQETSPSLPFLRNKSAWRCSRLRSIQYVSQRHRTQDCEAHRGDGLNLKGINVISAALRCSESERHRQSHELFTGLQSVTVMMHRKGQVTLEHPFR